MRAPIATNRPPDSHPDPTPLALRRGVQVCWRTSVGGHRDSVHHASVWQIVGDRVVLGPGERPASTSRSHEGAGPDDPDSQGQSRGEPVVEYDEELSTLHVSDPYFAFFLRWGEGASA
jgi:hypothetical protein